jgi:hypothetical protein
MARNITESVADAEAPALHVYRDEAGANHCALTFIPSRSDGRQGPPESVDRTLAQLQAGGVITNAERLEFIATQTKIRAGLRAIAGLT